MTLSPMQLGWATRLQKRGLLLREIAAELDVTFEAVCLALYGDNDWRKGDVDAAVSGFDADVSGARAAGSSGVLDAAGRPPDGGVGNAVAHGSRSAGRPPALRAPGPLGHRTGTVAAAPPARTGSERPNAADRPDASAVAPVEIAAAEAAARPPPAAAGPAAEPVVAAQPQGGAADAAPVVVDARAATPVLADRPRAAAAAPVAAPALDPARIYRLVEFDGQTLHQNRRSLTRLPQFFWRGTGEAVARLKRSMPQWQDLEPVETGVRPDGAER